MITEALIQVLTIVTNCRYSRTGSKNSSKKISFDCNDDRGRCESIRHERVV